MFLSPNAFGGVLDMGITCILTFFRSAKLCRLMHADFHVLVMYHNSLQELVCYD